MVLSWVVADAAGVAATAAMDYMDLIHTSKAAAVFD